MNFLPDWLQGIYTIISHTLRFVYDLFAKLWHVIVVVAGFLATFFQEVMAILAWLLNQFTAVMALLGDATTAVNAAMAAGWPPQMFGAVAWVNHYVPFAEAVAMLSALLFVYAITSVVRMVKSFTPTVA